MIKIHFFSVYSLCVSWLAWRKCIRNVAEQQPQNCIAREIFRSIAIETEASFGPYLLNNDNLLETEIVMVDMANR